MPKVTGTRRQMALELIRMLETGPALYDPHTGVNIEPRIMEQYRLWARTWIIPKVKKLVRELKLKETPEEQL